jgi:hypothetical protein
MDNNNVINDIVNNNNSVLDNNNQEICEIRNINNSNSYLYRLVNNNTSNDDNDYFIRNDNDNDNYDNTNEYYLSRLLNNNMNTTNRNRNNRYLTQLLNNNSNDNNDYVRIRNEINNLFDITLHNNRRLRFDIDSYLYSNDDIEYIDNNYEYYSDLTESMGKVHIGVDDINISAPISTIDDIGDNTCVICQEDNYTLPIRKTVCNHIFCSECIIPWLKKNHTCPLCLYDFN